MDINIYMFIYVHIYIYSSKSLDVVQSLYFLEASCLRQERTNKAKQNIYIYSQLN